MSDIIIAQRYANALSTVLEDDSALDAALSELQAFAGAYTDNVELRRVLSNPAIAAKDRQAIFNQVLALEQSTSPGKSTLEILYQRGRLALVSIVAKEFKQIVDTRLKRVVGVMTSVAPLSTEQENEIQESLSRYSGKRVQLETHINPEILGGIVVRMGDTIIDGSLRTRLAQLKQALLAEENGPYENSGH